MATVTSSGGGTLSYGLRLWSARLRLWVLYRSDETALLLIYVFSSWGRSATGNGHSASEEADTRHPAKQ